MPRAALPVVLALAAGAATTTPAAAAAATGATTQKQPHLVFMMADQLRWNTNGYRGGQQNLTVNLDRIAAEGLEMKYSWSSTPTCTPARAALLTGQSPWNHGMLGYGSVAQRYPVEMPRTIASAGYVTAAFGKDHFGWNATSNHGIDHGYASTNLYDGLGAWAPNKHPPLPHNWTGEFDDYDQWFAEQMPGKDPQATLDGLDGDGWNGWHGKAYVYDEYYHPTAWVGREAVNFIRGYDATPAGQAGTPYFLKVSFHRPHSPYDPPARVLNMTLQRELPPIVVSSDGWDDMFRGLKTDPPGCGPTADAWCGLMPADDVALSRAAYHASVQFVDEQVGRIYDALKEAGHLENALILWTSDHGDGQGDHYHWRKGYPYEFSAHVPLLLRWPENEFPAIPKPALRRGSVVAPPVVSELRDVFPTFLHATGVPGLVPDGHFTEADGQSLLCLLQDPTGQGKQCTGSPNNASAPFWRPYLDMEHSTCYNASNHWNALTDGLWKYVFNANSATEQLFDLASDPDETQDLSGHANASATLALWRGRMVAQFEREGRGSTWVSADGKLLARTKGQTYSPNFPKGPPASAGDNIVASQNGGQMPNCWAQEGENATVTAGSTAAAGDQPRPAGDNATAALGLIAVCEAPAPAMSGFCLTRRPDPAGADADANGTGVTASASSLTIEACQQPVPAAQNFRVLPAPDSRGGSSGDGGDAAVGGGNNRVVHIPTGQCATLPTAPDTLVRLEDCGAAAFKDAQLFVFGLSGRLCAGPCIGVDASWEARGATEFEVAARDTPRGMAFIPMARWVGDAREL